MGFVAKSVPLPRRPHRMRQQQTTALAGITGAERNPGKPGDECGIEGVLKQDRGVKPFRAQFASDAQPAARAAMLAARVIRDYASAKLLRRKHLADPRPGQQRHFGGRQGTPQRAQRGQADHRVAHPVGHAHQDAGASELTGLECIRHIN